MGRPHPAFVIERFSGEVPPWMLENNMWGEIRTHQVRTRLEQIMEERDTWQGKDYQSFNESDI